MPPSAAPRRLHAAVRGRLEKIQLHHRARLAMVYVRQPSPQHVLDQRESTQLPYDLVARAHACGWAAYRVLVIDDDRGTSGAHAAARAGFQRLVSEVSLNHVGLMLGIAITRLARSCRDWHQLLERCALFGTLSADSDRVYDPGALYRPPAAGPQGPHERGRAA